MTVPISNLRATWTNTDITYTGIGLNVNTISINANTEIANSNIVNFMINGNSVFRIDTSGVVNVANSLIVSEMNVYMTVVAAYNQANIGGSGGGGPAFDQANNAYNQANSAYIIAYNAYDKANAANYYAYLVDINAKAAFDAANSYRVNVVNETTGIAFRYLVSSNTTTTNSLFNRARTTPEFYYILNGGGSKGGISMTVNGRLGIRTSTPSYDLDVNGSLAAITKSFVIKHPAKENMRLRYASLEGPENGVYVRGRVTDGNYIELPDYWNKLVDMDTVTVSLTPIGKTIMPSVGNIKDDGVYLLSDSRIDCFYLILGERKDVDKLITEIPDGE